VTSTASDVTGFVALLGAAVIIAILAERVRIPAAVALVAVGAPLHVPVPFAFGDSVLFVFLPPLIFEAAWNLDLTALRVMAWRIAALAVPGTLVTAAIVGGALALTGVLPLAPALLFGAIVGATDPVAVVSAFRHAPVPVELRTLIEGESLTNDGIVLVVFGFALAFALGRPVPVGAELLAGAAGIAGGIAIGSAAALVCAAVLRATDAIEYELTVTIVLAYGAYLAASSLGWSGVFATAASAVALRGALLRLPTAMANTADVDRVWAAAAFIANACVFFATGLLIQPGRILHEPALVAVAVVSVWAARLLLASLAARRRQDRAIIFLAGMRGALPLALALSLPAQLAARPQIIDATYAIVLVTIVAQGALLVPVVGRFYGVKRGVAP